MSMLRFELHRDQDISGVSGIGVVAEGVMFDDGICVLHWHGYARSTGVYNDMEDVVTVHGHDGSTRVVWLDA